jgi:uncharacterized protein YlxW (UPF0749 family)
MNRKRKFNNDTLKSEPKKFKSEFYLPKILEFTNNQQIVINKNEINKLKKINKNLEVKQQKKFIKIQEENTELKEEVKNLNSKIEDFESEIEQLKELLLGLKVENKNSPDLSYIN